MFSERHGLPCWEQLLIKRFDLDHVAVAARSGDIAMLYDAALDVGLHVEVDRTEMQLTLGGASWGRHQETGSVYGRTQEIRRRFGGQVGEDVRTKQERRREALAEVLDDESDDLLRWWVDRFGHSSIRAVSDAAPPEVQERLHRAPTA